MRRPLPSSSRSLILASVLCLPLLLPGRVTAQDDVVVEARPTSARGQQRGPVLSLAGAIEKLDWDGDRRGPLIIVGPETIQPGVIKNPNGSKTPLELPRVPPPNGYSLAQLAPIYKQRVLRLRGLTALVPLEMGTVPTEANSEFLKRQAFEMDSMSGMTGLTQLLGSLNEAQWRLVGSEAGLGRGDLTAQQLPFFDRLIPDSRVLQSLQQPPARGGRPQDPRPPRKIPITAAMRNGIRIRILRHYRVGLLTLNSQREFKMGGLNTVPERPQYTLTSSYEENDIPKTPPVANRLKQGQMDFDSNLFDPNISLEGATTVGALLERVRQVTRVEVYADTRIAGIPVFVRGKAAPASEVLKALCWGLGGAFRRLQSGNVTFFLLTEDVIGLAPRLSRLTSGMIDGLLPSLSLVASSAGAMQKATFRIFEAKPMRYITAGKTFLTAQPNAEEGAADAIEFTPPSDLMERLVRPDLAGVAPPSDRPGPGRFNMSSAGEASVTVQASTLPQAIQNMLRDQAKSINEQLDQDPKVQDRPDASRAEVKMVVMVQLRHPTLGMLQETEVPRVGPAPAPPKQEDLMLPAGNKAVRMTVASPEEARRVVAALRQRGFNQLWLYLPDTLSEEAERETVKAAVAAGTNGSPVAILPVVTLLGRTLPAQADGYSDITSQGVSAGEWARERSKSPSLAAFPAIRDYVARQPDWLLPGSPPAAARVARITGIAGIPGIAGIAIRHAAPPNLFSPNPVMMSRQFDGFMYADVGFSSVFRMDFARRNQMDPIDFPAPFLGLMLGMEGQELENSPFLRSLRNDISVGMGIGMDEMDEEEAPQPKKVNLFGKWLEERQKPNSELLVRLHAALTKARPGLPIYLPDFIEGSPTPFDGNGADWWSSWDKADSFPGTKPIAASQDGRENNPPDVDARRSARAVVRVLGFESFLLQDEITASESTQAMDAPARRLFFSRWIATETKPLRDPKIGGRWDSICVDLAYQSLDTALDLLTIWPITDAKSGDAPTNP